MLSSPQLSFLQQKARSLNGQLTDSFTPLQLVAMTSVVTAVSIGVYQFVYGHDEGMR
jgi:hypothetical protein